MRRAVICVTAGLAAVAIGLGLNSATSKSKTEISVSNPTPTHAISIWEIHNQAHLEFLPVQQIEDQTSLRRLARSGEGALDMINMITTALDVGIMTGIVLFVAFGLTLRRDGPHRGSFE